MTENQIGVDDPTTRAFIVDLSSVFHEAELASSASFDHAGRAQLSAFTGKFAHDVATRATSIARDLDSPTVGDAYVKEAARGLSARASWRSQVALTLGGILVGGAVSGVISMSASSAWPVAAIIGSMLSGSVGMFLIGHARWT